jgi:hypothetical protein
MAEIIHLDPTRARRAPAKAEGRPAAQRLSDAQDKLNIAVHTLRGLTAEIDTLARRLHGIGDGALETDSEAIGIKLEKLRQCQVDYAEIARLLDSADIDGCIKLRDQLLSRA